MFGTKYLGLLYGKKEILKKLENQNHDFLDGDVPYTLNPGGPNHEELSSLIGIHEYFDNLYKHHFSDDINVDIRKKIVKINELIADHEEKIANPLLEFISSNKDINLIGKNRIISRNNLSDMNPNKLFNYMIQLMETEHNVNVLEDILFEIEDDKSKLILYNYDAFLVPSLSFDS